MKIGKKRELIYFFSLIIVLVFICTFFYIQKNEYSKINKLLIEDKTSSYPEIYDHLNSVSAQNFPTSINLEHFVVYVGRPSCGDCNLFEPKLIDLIQKFNIQSEITYLNVECIKKDEERWKRFKNQYSIEYTPTIALFSKGELISKIEWTPQKGISIGRVQEWLSNNKII
ncbi:DUF6568 family protein [Enterococcus sp. LJL99]